MLKLHGFRFSNYHNVVKVVLLEKGIAFEEVVVYPPADDAYRRKNPTGKFPSSSRIRKASSATNAAEPPSGQRAVGHPAFGTWSKSLASWRSGSWLDGSPQARLTIRPRCTAGRFAIWSVQRRTWVYSCTLRNSPAS